MGPQIQEASNQVDSSDTHANVINVNLSNYFETTYACEA